MVGGVFIMRKSLIVSIIVFFMALSFHTTNAGDYLSYQETTFEHQGMRFLDDYTEVMYDKYYKKVDKRKFWGWRTYTAYKTEKMYYTKETLYIIYNEGETPITETFRFETGDTVKKQYNVSGSIGLAANGLVEGFKLGLDSKLDHSITATTTESFEEEITIKVLVDPGTVLKVQIKGEGQLSNGVAAYYSFWRRIRIGGWEVFTITTEYYSIVKEQIDET